MPYWFKFAFAGIWPLIGDWAIPLAIIAAILLIEIFSVQIGVYLPFLAAPLQKLRKDLLWLAVAIAVALGWGAKMQRDDKARCDAKAAVVDEGANSAVSSAKAHHPPDRRWETNQ